MLSALFETTRLSAITSPVFVLDRNGRVCYTNRAFGSVTKKDIVSTVYVPRVIHLEETDGVGLCRVGFGSREKDFHRIHISAFNGSFDIFIDAALKNPAFPIAMRDMLCIRVETFRDRFSVPFFESYRIEKEIKNGGKKNAVLSNVCDNVADSYVRYVGVESTFLRIVDTFAEKVGVGGYKIAIAPTIDTNAICYLNMFDITLVTELILMMMLKCSNDRSVRLRLESAGNVVRVIFAAKCQSEGRVANVSPARVFEQDDPCNAVLMSAAYYCELYSWRLMVRRSSDEIMTVLSLPTKNCKSLRFAGEDDARSEKALHNATALLCDDIEYLLGL